MADHFYSTGMGAMGPVDVTEGTSTQSGVVELRIHDGAGLTKLEVLNCIEAIEQRIIRDSAPA